MAGYVADYRSDFGKVYRRVRLNSRLVTVDGITSRTQPSFDLPYLPPSFLSAVEESSKVNYCSLSIKPRAVRLYRDEGDYLYLEYPFMCNTPEYLTFVSELNRNPLILAVEYLGESLSDLYTDLLTK